MFSETLVDAMLVEAGLKFPNEEWFDALEDFAGPEPEALEYTPEQDEYYTAWLAKRQAKRAEKTAADHERETRAATMAFYTDEAIANEISPFDEDKPEDWQYHFPLLG